MSSPATARSTPRDRPKGSPDGTGQPHPLVRADRPLPGQPDDRARHDDRERRAAVDQGRSRLLRRPRSPGSSTPTCSPSAASCCSAAASATSSATGGCSSPASRSSRSPRSAAGSRARRACSIAARAVQGLGGAVASAVALSLMMTLFTEPAERAKAMGVFGFVASGGGTIGVLLGGVLTDTLDWHWIFLVNLPIGVAVVAALAEAAAGARRHAADGRRLDVAGAVTVTASLMLAVYAIVNGNQAGWASAADARPARRAPCAAGALPRDRVARRVAAGAARPVPAAQRRRREHRRRALGCRDVRLVLPLGALPAAGARLHARSRSGSPSCRRT